MKCSDGEVESQVIRVLLAYLPGGRNIIKLESCLVNDLCMDSMGAVEIAMEINEVFGIELPAEKVAKWRAVADICCSVQYCINYKE